MEHSIPRRERGQPAALRLTDEERRHLLDIVRRPGYMVLLKMMEIPCVLQDAKLVATPNGERDHVLGEHSKAQGMWEFFGFVQKQVEFEVNELYKEPPITAAEGAPAPSDDGLV